MEPDRSDSHDSRWIRDSHSSRRHRASSTGIQPSGSPGVWVRFRGDHTELRPEDTLDNLVRTIERRKCVFIENLINSGTDINGALIHAATRGYNVAVTSLLKAGAGVNAVDDTGDSALIAAATHGCINSVTTLMQAGADVNAIDRYGKTALVISAERGHVKIVEMLLEIQKDHPKELNLALIHAASKGNIRCIKILLQAGADVNGSDSKGFTALIRAANAYFKCSKFLIEAGADVNCANNLGFTALMEAVRYKNSKNIETLLNAGADVNMVNCNGSTALMIAVSERNMTAVNILLDEGADGNKDDNRGNTALTCAVMNNDVKTVALLTRGKSKVHPTGLRVAVENEFNQCLKLLLEAGADVNVRSSYGETLLISAAQRGNVAALELLLHAGADVNFVDCYGNTALMAAVGCGAIPSYHLLRKTGAQTRVLSQMTSFKSDYAKLLNMQEKSLKCAKLLLLADTKINQTNKFGENALQYYLMNFHGTSEEVALLLYAAGERLGNKLKQENSAVSGAPVPESLKELLCFKNDCRQSIRNQLLDLDPESHLFNRISQLALPTSIKSYLLFDNSLELKS